MSSLLTQQTRHLYKDPLNGVKDNRGGGGSYFSRSGNEADQAGTTKRVLSLLIRHFRSTQRREIRKEHSQRE